MTHCNAGALATGGYGTALGVVRAAYAADPSVRVVVPETRPLLQGSRLTAWELARDGIPHTLITDSMAASMMAGGAVSHVVVGADRIAANGDVANKIGTYGLAVLAREHGIAVFVAAPTTTIDLSTPTGRATSPSRSAPPTRSAASRCSAAPAAAGRTAVANPAFDVTPARLIAAIITEAGAHRPPYERSLAAAMRAAGAGARRPARSRAHRLDAGGGGAGAGPAGGAGRRPPRHPAAARLRGLRPAGARRVRRLPGRARVPAAAVVRGLRGAGPGVAVDALRRRAGGAWPARVRRWPTRAPPRRWSAALKDGRRRGLAGVLAAVIAARGAAAAGGRGAGAGAARPAQDARERGFNQSLLLARALSRPWGRPVARGAGARSRGRRPARGPGKTRGRARWRAPSPRGRGRAVPACAGWSTTSTPPAPPWPTARGRCASGGRPAVGAVCFARVLDGGGRMTRPMALPGLRTPSGR